MGLAPPATKPRFVVRSLPVHDAVKAALCRQGSPILSLASLLNDGRCLLSVQKNYVAKRSRILKDSVRKGYRALFQQNRMLDTKSRQR